MVQVSFTINPAALQKLFISGPIVFLAAFFMTADPTLDPAPDPAPGPRRKVWRTTLFVIGSAAFSGVALVLWNRRELTRIRQTTPPPAANPSDDEII